MSKFEQWNIGRTLSRRNFMAGTGAALLAAGVPLNSAKAEGRIVVYSTTLPPIQKRVADAFTRKTGIEVQSLRLTTSPLAQRFLAEQQAGQYLCDVITLGNDIFYRQISEQGLLLDIADMPVVKALPDLWRKSDKYVMIMYGPQSIAYNTQIVKGDAIPKTWEDVLRPEFEGKLIMADPRANETIVGFLNMLHNAYGDEFLKKLGAQKPRLVASVPQGVEQIIAGDGSVLLPCLAMNLVQYEGKNAPVACIPTPSPTNGTYFFSGIAKNAPNPEGARLWFEYLLSAEGQELLCKDNGVSPLGQIPGSLQPADDLVDFDLAKALEKARQLYDLLGFAA